MLLNPVARCALLLALLLSAAVPPLDSGWISVADADSAPWNVARIGVRVATLQVSGHFRGRSCMLQRTFLTAPVRIDLSGGESLAMRFAPHTVAESPRRHLTTLSVLRI